MRTAIFYSLLIAALAGPLTPTPGKTPPPVLSVTAPARTPMARPGGEITYDVRLAANIELSSPRLALSAALPEDLVHVVGSTQINSRPAPDPVVWGQFIRWDGLPAPSNRPGRHGIHTLVQDIMDPSHIADYTRAAFENYWSRDDRLLAVMPFELSAPFNDWPAWDWVFSSSGTRDDGSPDRIHRVYEAVRNLPRQTPTLVVTFKLSVHRLEGNHGPELTVFTSAGKLSAKAETVTVADLPTAGVVSGRVVLRDRRPPPGTTVTVGRRTVETSPDGS
jgi:hypothetical protein